MLGIQRQNVSNAILQCSEEKMHFFPRPNILACGDGAGAVVIWKLAERFSNAQNDEIENLQLLGKSFGDN